MSHFLAECPNFLKKQNKSYVLTLSNDEFEHTSEFEADVKALASNISSDTSSTKILKYDVFIGNVDKVSQSVSDGPSYQALFNKWQDDLKVLNVQKERIELLLVDSHRLTPIITKLKCEKESICKNIQMLNIGTDSLEDILSKGKVASDNSGLDFSKSEG